MNIKMPEIKQETLLKVASALFTIGGLVVTNAISAHNQKKNNEEIEANVLKKIYEQQNS